MKLRHYRAAGVRAAGTTRRRLPLIRRPGWPKLLPCLVCGRMRLAPWAGDRLHAKCVPRIEDALGAAGARAALDVLTRPPLAGEEEGGAAPC